MSAQQSPKIQQMSSQKQNPPNPPQFPLHWLYASLLEKLPMNKKNRKINFFIAVFFRVI